MKKLKVDLDLLVQSFSFNDDDLGKEYLDTFSGEIVNIPNELNNVVCGNGDENSLEDWQKELLEEAYAVKDNREERYVLIPNINELYFYNAMVDFARQEVFSEKLKEALLKALNNSQPMRNFKSIIYSDQKELDNWHNYEEEKAKEYVVKWLKNIGIALE
jgi:trans-aconitate methyltransferase